MALSSTKIGIETSINSTQADIDLAENTKKDLRLAIDCRANSGFRSQLFDYYEDLCKQTVIMKNVLTDLKIKVNILEKEKQRCQDRSKIFHISSFFGRIEHWVFMKKVHYPLPTQGWI